MARSLETYPPTPIGGDREAVYAAILDSIRPGVAVFDRELRLTICNKRYLELFDYPPDIVRVGTRYEDIIRFNMARGGVKVDDIEKHVASRLAAARDDRVQRRMEHRRADGTIVLIRRLPLPVGGFINIYMDWTRRTQFAREAERNAQLLRLTLENMADGVRVFDRDLKLVAWNSKSFEMLNYPPELAKVGTPFEAFLDYHAKHGDYDAAHPVEGKHARKARAGRAYGRGSEVVSVDGRMIQKRRNPMPDGGFVSTYQDVTALKHAHAMLVEAKEKAELASRAKSEFLANISHELRTPLNAIIGFSQIMCEELRGPLNNPDYREYARLIQDSGQHLLAIINDVLDLSKIEAGKAKLQEEIVDVEDLVRSCMRLIEEKAKAESLELRLDCQQDMPHIKADIRLLKQTLLNLLSNALKFTPSGGSITVTVAAKQALTISVADTGIGMDEADIPKAFNPFTQLDNRLARKFEGTGLGLPLAASFMRLHGGTLTITSKKDHGTTATIALPAERIERKPTQA